MILGGGSCQINLIKRAKAEGHYVILADYLDDCPGRALADVYLPISTFDLDGVLRAAGAYGVDGIVTTGTDQPVYTAAVASERLGLHFYIGSETAKAVTNKRVMKQIFVTHHIPHNAYRLIGCDLADDALGGLQFPAVLKPVDSQGQRGVVRVNNIAEVRANIQESLSFSRESEVMLEEFYNSDEITVNGWVANGKTTILTVVDRVTIKDTNHIGVCLCHNCPSVHVAAYGEQIRLLTEKIVSAFEIKNGPIYFQYLIGDNGIKVNEIAMRIGGAYEDLTIPIISGIDILGLLLQTIQNGRCDTKALEAYDYSDAEKFVSTQMFFCREGRVRSISPQKEIRKLDGVLDVSYAIGKGSVLGSIENATARAGYVIIEGTSFHDMINRVNRMFDTLKVKGDNGDNLVIKYSNYPRKYVFADIRDD